MDDIEKCFDPDGTDEIIDQLCKEKDLSTDGSRIDKMRYIENNIGKRLFGAVTLRVSFPRVLAFDLLVKDSGRFFSRSISLCRDDSSYIPSLEVSKQFWDCVLELEISLDGEDLAW